MLKTVRRTSDVPCNTRNELRGPGTARLIPLKPDGGQPLL
jgi:hypothetical protein